MPLKAAAVEGLLSILTRCWAVLYEALMAAALSLVCGMGLLMHLDESRRGAQPQVPSRPPIPAQRQGNEWERIPPRRG